MNNEVKKITREDLEIKKGTIEVDCIVVDGKTINLTPVIHESIHKYITYANCSACGKEFKKDYSYDNQCSQCRVGSEWKRYNELNLVEWDGETPLCIFNDDTYFFSMDEILDYLEDGEGIEISDLMLCVCERSTFREVDFDYFIDEVHEDWEPSDEMKKKLEEFNDFLRSEPTNTWFQGKQRVTLKKEDING